MRPTRKLPTTCSVFEWSISGCIEAQVRKRDSCWRCTEGSWAYGTHFDERSSSIAEGARQAWRLPEFETKTCKYIVPRHPSLHVGIDPSQVKRPKYKHTTGKEISSKRWKQDKTVCDGPNNFSSKLRSTIIVYESIRHSDSLAGIWALSHLPQITGDLWWQASLSGELLKVKHLKKEHSKN